MSEIASARWNDEQSKIGGNNRVGHTVIALSIVLLPCYQDGVE